MYGNTIRLKGIYNINSLLATGLGVGVEVLENPHYSTYPIFALMEVTPFQTNLATYFFSTIGYGISSKTSNSGLLLELGVGYKKMFRKHFGMDIHAGYNLKNINYDIVNESAMKIESSMNTRHSLLMGFGFIF